MWARHYENWRLILFNIGSRKMSNRAKKPLRDVAQLECIWFAWGGLM